MLGWISAASLGREVEDSSGEQWDVLRKEGPSPWRETKWRQTRRKTRIKSHPGTDLPPLRNNQPTIQNPTPLPAELNNTDRGDASWVLSPSFIQIKSNQSSSVQRVIRRLCLTFALPGIPTR